jgi:ribonuclease Y
MLETLLINSGVATLGGVIGFLISKKMSLSHFDHYEKSAQAKANAIESEAHLLLERSTKRSSEIEKEALRKYDEVYTGSNEK